MLIELFVNALHLLVSLDLLTKELVILGFLLYKVFNARIRPLMPNLHQVLLADGTAAAQILGFLQELGNFTLLPRLSRLHLRVAARGAPTQARLDFLIRLEINACYLARVV